MTSWDKFMVSKSAMVCDGQSRLVHADVPIRTFLDTNQSFGIKHLQIPNPKPLHLLQVIRPASEV